MERWADMVESDESEETDHDVQSSSYSALEPCGGESSWTMNEGESKLSAPEDDDEYENDLEVEIEGVHVPPPVNSFSEIDLAEELKKKISLFNYVNPTLVQRHAIPVLLSGRDLLACGRAGSGKILAFVFPVISFVIRDPARSRSKRWPIALILVPTKILGAKILRELRKHDCRNKAMNLFDRREITSLRIEIKKREADILVATPARLNILLKKYRRYFAGVFDMIKYLIMYEPDMESGPEIHRIVDRLGERQTVIVSSTQFPENLQAWALNYLTPTYVSVSILPALLPTFYDDITQEVVFVDEGQVKRTHLLELLHKGLARQKKTLIYLNTWDNLKLTRCWLLDEGISDMGYLLRIDKMETVHDYLNVDHVVNFEFPRFIEKYVSRIEPIFRQPGLVTSFFSENDINMAKPLCDFMQLTNQKVPDWLVQMAIEPEE